MSAIVYNGVAMTLVQTRRYAQTPIQLARDVAGYRHTLTVLATVGLRTFGPAVGDNAGVPLGVSGVGVWVSLRDQLMTPRKALKVVVGDVVLTDTPDAGFLPPDIQLGPTPLAANCVGFNGTGSMLVEFTIQWSKPNDCPTVNGKMAVLAHAWSSEDDIDQDYYLTRVYQGRIIFDPRVVGAVGTIGKPGFHPDVFLRIVKPPFLLPPRTPGMYRVKTLVRLSEDGCTLTYACFDRQPAAFVNALEVTRIVAQQSCKQITPSPAEIADSAAALVGAGARILAGRGVMESLPLSATPAGRAFVAAQAGAEAASQLWSAFAAGYKGIPIAAHAVEVTAYGRPNTRYTTLARAARVVALYRLMKATNVGEGEAAYPDWGGTCEQLDTSEPKATTLKLTFNTRPRVLTPAPQNVFGSGILGNLREQFAQMAGLRAEQNAAGQTLWNSGGNEMPRLPGNRPFVGPTPTGNPMVNEPITGTNGQPIPPSIRQLVYGGTIGAAGFAEWGWPQSAFAPDLMSDRDAGVRGVETLGRNAIPLNAPGAGTLEFALIQALQNPCGYKVPATLNTTLQTELPK